MENSVWRSRSINRYKLIGWQRMLAAVAAGAIAVLAHAPFDFPPAAFVAFPVLVWLLHSPARPIGRWRASGQAFLTGWWFGLGYFVAGLWWIGNALLVEAGSSLAWAIPIAVLALPAFLALFYGLACLPSAWYRGPLLGRILLLAAGFGLAEWLRTFLFTGFPWNAIGYAAMPAPLLMQAVAPLGLDTINALAVFVFSTPALLFAASWRQMMAGGIAAVLLVLAAAGYGHWRLGLPEPGGEPLQVRIVQPAIDQALKWDRDTRDRIFHQHLALSADAPGRLVIWPETSVPFLFSERPEALAEIGEMLGPDRILLAGAVRDERDPLVPGGRRFYNSMLVIDVSGEIIAAADKLHLVPFGEYLPLASLLETFGLRQLVTAPGLFSAAAERSPLQLGELSLLPLICYEIIFAREVSRSAGDAQVIVNITNDAWYGDTPGPYQHLRKAQVRAVETGLPVLRAANTGISAAIDSRGRFVASLALDQAGSIDATVIPGPFPGRTYHGIAFVVVLLLFFVVPAMMHAAARL